MFENIITISWINPSFIVSHENKIHELKEYHQMIKVSSLATGYFFIRNVVSNPN